MEPLLEKQDTIQTINANTNTKIPWFIKVNIVALQNNSDTQYKQAMQIPTKIFHCLSQSILWPLINKSKTNTATNKIYKQK